MAHQVGKTCCVYKEPYRVLAKAVYEKAFNDAHGKGVVYPGESRERVRRGAWWFLAGGGNYELITDLMAKEDNVKVLADNYMVLARMHEMFSAAFGSLMGILEGPHVDTARLKEALLDLQALIPDAITDVVRIEGGTD